jgi:hypothetical protein
LAAYGTALNLEAYNPQTRKKAGIVMPNALRNTLALIAGASSWVSASSREKRNAHGAKPDHHEIKEHQYRRASPDTNA